MNRGTLGVKAECCSAAGQRMELEAEQHADDIEFEHPLGALLRMNRGAAYLVGKQDFHAYMAQGSTVASTVRTVKAASVEREGNMIVFRISADGFLYNMVRILAGTLIDVGLGKLSPEDIPSITASRDRSRAGMTVPACGLYLNRVLY